MPSTGRRAVVKSYTGGEWINRHENVVQPFDRFYDIWNPPPPNANDFMGDLRAGVAAMQEIMADALRDRKRLRAIGGGWSLSHAAVTDGRLINTKPLNWYFPVGQASVVPGYPKNYRNLLYLQCGASVEEVNNYLFARGQALKTSGASNGQTIVGAFSTGTHGSAYDVGAMQDYVVGMQIITSPTRVIWLERASYPVIADSLAAKLDVEIVRDDLLFNAALVSFGSFGLIYGVMIEADPLYLLETNDQRVPIDSRLFRAMNTLDFRDLQLPYPSERPYHFSVTVNPHNLGPGAVVTTMYRRPYRTGYPRRPATTSGIGPGDDLLAVVGTLTGFLPGGIIGSIVNALEAQVLPEVHGQWGTPGETFKSIGQRGKAMSIELGIPVQMTGRVLELLLSLHPEVNKYPGFLAFRFVKGSRALLAFTKFDVTCTVELPAAFADGTAAYYQRLWSALEAEGIPYTLHWGQMNNFTPARVRAMYGHAVDDWLQARRTLLPDPNLRALFSSPFLEVCGLAT